MRIATWNINSLRARTEILAQLVRERAPDVICLQETKVEDALFPHALFDELGYIHRVINGIRNYHGVALVSRLPFSGSGRRDWCDKVDGRHVHATVDGVEIHSVYVPAGGDIPDPALNVKFAHKLAFMGQKTAWWAARRDDGMPRILLGDLNVAPLETDVWSHKQLLNVVSHTPIEVEHLLAWQRAGGWIDAVRQLVPAEEKLYSWWSYRAKDWRAADRGRRLDHAWVTAPLAPVVAGCEIMKDARDWTRPSDHVPVIVDLRL
ncbi:MAG: exodeoxyribonuclease III [Alphaproteobacteria bacterium]